MRAILVSQQSRIQAQLDASAKEQAAQLELAFPDPAERRQVEADRVYWRRRLEKIPGELESEPARVRASYEVSAWRVEPAGVVYLWPVSA